jgi:hypothetical protein
MSLLQFKPAPMYILDEVDAALDLSHTQNIGRLIKTRFKGYFLALTTLTQIPIHRRKFEGGHVYKRKPYLQNKICRWNIIRYCNFRLKSTCICIAKVLGIQLSLRMLL